MIIQETELSGAFIIEPEQFVDDRGFFAEVWSSKEFARHKLLTSFSQGNISWNKRKGTLRGLHFQVAPHAQAKLTICTRGAIFDVGVDLRPESPTFKRWIGYELSERNRRVFYLPEGFAHGYQTLEDDTTVFYQVSAEYQPLSSRGFRWDDLAFRIEWPNTSELVIDERDRNYPDFSRSAATF